MRVTRVLSVFLVLAATSLVANAQNFAKVSVHLPYTVVAGSKQLAPGDYEILPVPVSTGEKLLKVYSDDSSSFEALLWVIPATKPDPARTSELVLRDNGQGEYTLDQMWIQGSEVGYEFLAPKSAGSRGERLTSVEVRAESTR
jgi:hypothetical protein